MLMFMKCKCKCGSQTPGVLQTPCRLWANHSGDSSRCSTENTCSGAGLLSKNMERSHRVSFFRKDGKSFAAISIRRRITQSQWEEFVAQKTSSDSLALGQVYTDLAKKNLYPHHLGTFGYAAKIPEWRRKEEEMKQARTLDPLVLGRKPKVVDGALKFKEPQTEEVV